MKTISLSSFANKYTVNKGTVYRKCQELGISTVAGLDQEAVDRLLNAFGLNKQDSIPDRELMDAVPTVEVGNHAMVLAAPTLPSSYSLETLRTSEVTAFEDPLAVANQALAIADQIQQAMKQDLQQRQIQLQQTTQANDALGQKIQEMKLEQRLYQMQADQLNQQTTAKTQSLQDAIAALGKLGKQESGS